MGHASQPRLPAGRTRYALHHPNVTRLRRLGTFTAVEQVVQEAQRQLEQGEWEPAPGDPALARQTDSPADVQEGPPRIDRLEGLREPSPVSLSPSPTPTATSPGSSPGAAAD
ncbi:hypothetical protein [Kitasatospora sp. NPDC085879]|uniref:hypothetical protein n=1 Tax=Kitasatospora sp. NPDC085879 TaxID=3154769 RepID=UPI003449D3DA